MDIKKVYINEETYPTLLREIKDPPDPLYYAGNLQLTEKICAAIVGSRKTSQYGRWASRALAGKIAGAGGVVVSGMAAGIDTCAHWGAIDAAPEGEILPTIAVLGCGIDVCYPKTNQQLWNDLSRKGLVVSEYPPGTQPAKYTFPRRNRIISGLSSATVVVNAPVSSGALITAEMAAEQGRDVYVIPGNINSAYNFGSNKLLRDGAMPLVLLDDLVEDLGLNQKNPILIEETFGEDEITILKLLLKHGEMTADSLCRETDFTIQQVHGMVTILEMKGVVSTALGKIFIAK